MKFSGKNLQQDGFTLIELIIVIAIMVLLGAMGLSSFVASRNSRDLSTQGQDAISVLRVAQSKTLAGEQDSTWGVHLDKANGKYYLFSGSYFSPGNANNAEYDIPTNLQIANINISGGGNDIIFNQLSGTTNQSGSFDIQIMNTSSDFTINIDHSGKIYQQGTAPVPANTRVIDSRHLFYTLPSIQSNLLITLTFLPPLKAPFIYTVTMLPYFNIDKSNFDWSGDVSVYGVDEPLRIHTTYLSATSTTLSIDRDCRRNIYPVDIKIDTTDVANYQSNCYQRPVGATDY